MNGIPLTSEESWKFSVLGKSGVFKTRNNLYVEYIQSSMKINELRNIVPVREVFDKGELDFELMLQRDLDDDRIQKELVPYLLRDKKIGFFPSILVVILEINRIPNNGAFKHEISSFYPKLVSKEDYIDKGNEFQVRDYGDLFRLKILKTNNKLQRWYTELSVGHNATLLAIDGQHRLTALKVVSGILDETLIERFRYSSEDEKYKKEFDEIDIPVTFIFIPNSFTGSDKSVSLIEAFRQVFVDVNKNARKVSIMRNILLDENDLCSIFTRMICSNIREKSIENNDSVITIDEIEWDKVTREQQITDSIALTNIVFINKLFEKWIGGDSGSELKANLKLDRFKGDLDSNDFSYENLSVRNFSQFQKEKVKEIFKSEYLEGFTNIISSLPFALERSKGVRTLRQDIEKLITDKKSKDKQLYIDVRNCIFEGNDYKYLLKKKADVREIVNEKIDKFVKKNDENTNMELIRTQMFQSAFFQVVLDFFPFYMESNPDKGFRDFTELIKKCIESADFKKQWKKIFSKFKEYFEKAIKGKKQYSMSKSNLIYKYLKIFIVDNKEIFSDLSFDFNKIPLERDEVKEKFIDNFRSYLDEELIDINMVDELNKFRINFLKKIYL